MSTETIDLNSPKPGREMIEIIRAAAARPGTKTLVLKVPACSGLGVEAGLQLGDAIRTASKRVHVAAILEGPDAHVDVGAYVVGAAATRCYLHANWQDLRTFQLSAADRAQVAAHLAVVRPGSQIYLAGGLQRQFIGHQAVAFELVDGIGLPSGEEDPQVVARPSAPATSAAKTYEPEPAPWRPAPAVAFASLSSADKALKTSRYAKENGCGFVEAFKALGGDGGDESTLAARRYAIEHRCSEAHARKALAAAA